MTVEKKGKPILVLEDIRLRQCIKKYIKGGCMTEKPQQVLEIKTQGEWVPVRVEIA